MTAIPKEIIGFGGHGVGRLCRCGHNEMSHTAGGTDDGELKGESTTTISYRRAHKGGIFA